MLNTIYKVTNLINGKVYIGKTQLTIEERWREHLRDYKKERCEKRPFYDAINKYKPENFQIEIVETNIPDELINEKEQFYINQYRSYIGFEDCNGYNATLGGDGAKRLNYDIQEVIKKFQECKMIKETARAFNLDPSFTRRLLQANNVDIPPVEERLKIIKKKRSRPVYQIDLNEDIILNEFESLQDAANFLKEKGIVDESVQTPNSYISEVCREYRKKNHKAYNFRWYFKEDWDLIIKKSKDALLCY